MCGHMNYVYLYIDMQLLWYVLTVTDALMVVLLSMALNSAFVLRDSILLTQPNAMVSFN